MLRIFRLPIYCLLFIVVLINLSFSLKENTSHTYSFKHFSFRDSSTRAYVVMKEEAESPDSYTKLHLVEKGVSRDAFSLALKGFNRLLQKRLLRNKNILTLIDFSKPSNKKRLYVIDVKRNKILFETLVAHGRNSGLEYASSFSNDDDSHKSSLGFFITLNSYVGECGYALKLKGCEKGFNDKAFERAIVMHGSEYVNEEFIKSNGFLGRSWGCPALPEKMNKKIIDIIKNGSCLFVYHPTKKYLLTSPLLHG